MHEFIADERRLFKEAIGITSRCLRFIQQFSSSPYGWFTKRIRDVHSSAFLSLILASGFQMDAELADSAWTVLDQLFPIDARTGNLVQTGLSETLFGKVLIKARQKRDVYSGPAMHNVATGSHHTYPGAMAAYVPATLPTTSASGAFQSSGTLFEDFDSMMQDPWSSGLSGMEPPYGSWVCISPVFFHDSSSLFKSAPFLPSSSF